MVPEGDVLMPHDPLEPHTTNEFLAAILVELTLLNFLTYVNAQNFYLVHIGEEPTNGGAVLALNLDP